MDMKRCSRCAELKQVSLFYVQRDKKDGRQCHCKECLKTARKLLPSEKKEERRKYMSNYFRSATYLAYKARPKVMESARMRARELRATPGFREKERLTALAWMAIPGNKEKKYAVRKEYLARPEVVAANKKIRDVKRATQAGRFYEYRRQAKGRSIVFDLSFEQFASFWNKPCCYCNEIVSPIGLDRLDNSVGYLIHNVASCCTMCNIMKKNHTREDFIKKCQLIARTAQ